MSNCDNYNRIIEAIEENIYEEEKDIYIKAASAAGLSKRDAATVVKNVEGEDYATYIKRRKIIRCAQEKATNPNEAWQDIAGKFAIFDYTTFNRRFKAFIGVRPEDFLTKFKDDIWGYKPGYVSKDNVIVKTQTVTQTKTEKIYIHEERKASSVESREARGATEETSKIKKIFGSTRKQISREDMEKYIVSRVKNDIEVKQLVESYKTVMELEEMQAIYGLTFTEVLYLYIKGSYEDTTLYKECEKISDAQIDMIYGGADYEYDFVYDDEPDWEEREEWEAEYRDNEMSVAESYAYYRGEDEMEYDYEDGYNNNDINDMYW